MLYQLFSGCCHFSFLLQSGQRTGDNFQPAALMSLTISVLNIQVMGSR